MKVMSKKKNNEDRATEDLRDATKKICEQGQEWNTGVECGERLCFPLEVWGKEDPDVQR